MHVFTLRFSEMLQDHLSSFLPLPLNQLLPRTQFLQWEVKFACQMCLFLSGWLCFQALSLYYIQKVCIYNYPSTFILYPQDLLSPDISHLYLPSPTTHSQQYDHIYLFFNCLFPLSLYSDGVFKAINAVLKIVFA